LPQHLPELVVLLDLLKLECWSIQYSTRGWNMSLKHSYNEFLSLTCGTERRSFPAPHLA
jgi:hypothetical protein